MYNWRLLVVCTVLIVVCAAQDMELLARPIRPEQFVNNEDVQDYILKLKAYHLQNGHSRYGKRFSPSLTTNTKMKYLPENWRSIFEIMKHYKQN